jgi:hypothetical protein
VRSLLSWRGWSSASAVFCKARSRHSAAVSMAFLGGPRRGASKQKAPNASVQNRTPRKTRKKSPAEAGLETGMKVSGKRAFLPSHQLTEAVSVPTRRSLDRCDGARRSRLPLDVGLARRAIVASGRLAIGKEKASPKRGRIYFELSFSASPDVTSRIKSAKRGNVEPRCRAS